MRELDDIKFRHVFKHDGTGEIRFIFVSLWEIAREDRPRIDNTIRWDWLGSEQYTGLTDATGREIYEGDIVRAQGAKNYRIEYHYGCFGGMVGTDETGRDAVRLYHLESPVVVGNVYENPELLQDTP